MRIVVESWEQVLRYRDGRLVEVLGSGAHRRPRWRTRRVHVDLRPVLVTVPSQEVLTQDAVAVKVALLARRRVVDARRWYESAPCPPDVVYAALQVALRDAVGVRPLDALLADRAVLGAEVAAAAADAVAELGAQLLDVRVRDLGVPAELRRAAVDAAAARAQGLAALERARSETAALRALANAARTAADNPALLHLRTLQAVERGGATLVLANGAVPVAPS